MEGCGGSGGTGNIQDSHVGICGRHTGDKYVAGSTARKHVGRGT